VLFHVDAREHVFFHETLGDDDGVFVVVALPRHERDEEVLAERELALVGARAVGKQVALLHLLAFAHARNLVDRRVLVRATELDERVLVVFLGQVVVAHHDVVARHGLHRAVAASQHEVGAVAGGAGFDAGADERCFGAHERHGLALHVGAHQRAVGVVVLDERNQRGRDRNDLARRHVDEVDLLRIEQRQVGGRTEERLGFEHLLQVFERGGLRRAAHEHLCVHERAVFVDGGVRFGDDVLLFFVGSHVAHLVGDAAVLHAAVRRFDEAVRVDSRVGGKRTLQTDVRAFRRLDRAHAAVVREVHVAHFEAGALARQTARAEGRETAAVREARQGVGLVHELRQLRRVEELLDRTDERTHVDEALGRQAVVVLRAHALAHHALDARETDAHLVLDQFTDRAQAAVGKVVLVVEAVARSLLHEVQEIGDGGEHFAAREHVGCLFRNLCLAPFVVLAQPCRHVDLPELAAFLQTEQFGEFQHFRADLAEQLVATDARGVIAARLEERALEVDARRLHGGGFARLRALHDLDHRLVAARGEVLLAQPLLFEEVEVLHETLEESGRVLLVVAERAQDEEDAETALARDACTGGRVLARLVLDVELEPLAALRVDGALHQLVLGEVAQAVALARFEDHARRTHELRNDHLFDAVHEERAALGHLRELADVDELLLDFTGVAVGESRLHETRHRIRVVLGAALRLGELRPGRQLAIIGIKLELELQRTVRHLDRRQVFEHFAHAVAHEPVE